MLSKGKYLLCAVFVIIVATPSVASASDNITFGGCASSVAQVTPHRVSTLAPAKGNLGPLTVNANGAHNPPSTAFNGAWGC